MVTTDPQSTRVVVTLILFVLGVLIHRGIYWAFKCIPLGRPSVTVNEFATHGRWVGLVGNETHIKKSFVLSVQCKTICRLDAKSGGGSESAATTPTKRVETT